MSVQEVASIGIKIFKIGNTGYQTRDDGDVIALSWMKELDVVRLVVKTYLSNSWYHHGVLHNISTFEILPGTEQIAEFINPISYLPQMRRQAKFSRHIVYHYGDKKGKTHADHFIWPISQEVF